MQIRRIKNGRWLGNYVRALGCFGALGCVLVAHGQTVPGDGSLSNLPSRLAGNSVQFERFMATSTNVGKLGLTAGSTGSISAATLTRLPNGTPVTVTGTMTKAQVAGAIGRLARKVVYPLVAGVALYDFADELGLVAAISGGVAQFTTKGSGGYMYYVIGRYDTLKPSAAAACNDWAAKAVAGYGVMVGSLCYAKYPSGTDYDAMGVVYEGSAPVPGVSVSMEQFDAIVAMETFDPVDTALPRVLKDAIQSGEQVEVVPNTVTGPATSPGPVKTGVGPDGKVTTATTTNNYNYAGNKVTNNTTTVTNVYNPSTSTTETTTQEQPAEEEQKSQCEQYPDSAGCAELDVPDGEIPKSTKVISYTEETPFGTGSCPANLTASVATLGATITVWDWQKTCAYSLPLRALVIALASFAAFLIVMPTKVDV